MKKFTSLDVGRAIIRARPWTLTALILRMSNKFQCVQPAFMRLVNAVNDVESPSGFLFSAFHDTWEMLPFYIRAVVLVGERLAPRALLDPILRYVINKMIVPYFVVENEDAYKKIEARFAKDGSGVIRDIVGEEARTEEEENIYLKCYLEMIAVPGSRVSVKPSSLCCLPDKNRLKQKLEILFEAANESGASVTVDAEEYFRWCIITEEAFLETILEPRFCNTSNEVGIALQTYRKDAMQSAKKILSVAQRRCARTLVRIVKGAYWGSEREQARKRGKPFPLYEFQEDTDWNFNKITALFMRHRDCISVSVASHNAATIASALNRAHGDYRRFAVEVLNGMGESIRVACRKLHVPVLVYLPTVRQGGCVKEAMAYLCRRLDEVANRSDVMKNI